LWFVVVPSLDVLVLLVLGWSVEWGSKFQAVELTEKNEGNFWRDFDWDYEEHYFSLIAISSNKTKHKSTTERPNFLKVLIARSATGIWINHEKYWLP
jgi:hypothetical protein